MPFGKHTLTISLALFILVVTIGLVGGAISLSGSAVKKESKLAITRCTDSDYGFNVDFQGKTTGKCKNGERCIMTDTCMERSDVVTRGSYLIEYSCGKQPAVIGRRYSCSCLNGVCKSRGTTIQTFDA